MMGDSGDRFDVIVIGAGIMGSCTAYQIAKRGHRTLLLEQFDLLHHRGSSHGESRTMRTTYPEAYYCPLVIESAKLWEEAQSEIGYLVHFKAPQLDMGPFDNKSLEATIANCRSHSIPHRVLNRHQVAKEFSGSITLPENWIGLLTGLGGVLRATKAVSMFQALALQHGAVLKDHTQVKGIEREGGRGGIVVSTTTGKRFWARKCVITAGAWLSKLVKAVNGLDLPIQIVESSLCYWRVKDGLGPNYSMDGGLPTFASYGNPYIYGTPSLEYPSLIKVGIHGGQTCDPDNRTWVCNVSLDSMKRWIDEVFMGQVDSSRPIMTQSCLYSMTPDEDFVIDFLGGKFGKDLVVGGGFSGHGFKMGPVVGRILAELALDGEAQGVDLSHFRLGRFLENPKGNLKSFEGQVGYGLIPVRPKL